MNRLLNLIAALLQQLNDEIRLIRSVGMTAARRISGIVQSLPAQFQALGRPGQDVVRLGAVSFLIISVIEYYELSTSIFTFIEHNPDYEIDTAILAGITTSISTAIFAFRRWRELTAEVQTRVAAEARANTLACEDMLTGLPNRRALTMEMERAIARSRRDGRALSVLLLDLDRFKPVNDVYGHVAGDALLREITSRITGITRAEEFVARLGGDEFAIVLEHELDDSEAPETVARRINATISSVIKLGSADVHVGVSIGIASFPQDADDADTLLRRSDIALYRAKHGGRGKFKRFETAMDAELRERAQIESDLREAIRQELIVPHFQPLVDLQSGAIVGFEALARWDHPRHGNIPPVKFIAIAEDCGLIQELGLSMLRQACRHAQGWAPELTLSVNISPIQLRDPWLAEKIVSVLLETGLPAARLDVEITESALIQDIDAAKAILKSLKNQGIAISLDDFGSGYSSLQHLSTMPFDRIKIDQQFVKRLDETEDANKIIRAIVGLSESLGLTTTGEGIETAENAEVLRAVGCHVGQGWFFGRPMDASAVLRLIEGRQGADVPDLRFSA